MIPLGYTACPIITCKYCKYLYKSEAVDASFLERTFKTKTGCWISCLTSNMIYRITCLQYRTQHVGETNCKIRSRMYEHIQSIELFSKGKQTTLISEHFNLCCKRLAKLTFHTLETIRTDPALDKTTKSRCKSESWWILNLRTLQPMGLNLFGQNTLAYHSTIHTKYFSRSNTYANLPKCHLTSY